MREIIFFFKDKKAMITNVKMKAETKCSGKAEKKLSVF